MIGGGLLIGAPQAVVDTSTFLTNRSLAVLASTYAGAVNVTGYGILEVDLDESLDDLDITWPAGNWFVDVVVKQNPTGGWSFGFDVGVVDIWQGRDAPLVDRAPNAITRFTLISRSGFVEGIHGQVQTLHQFSTPPGVAITAPVTNASVSHVHQRSRILAVVATQVLGPTGGANVLNLMFNGVTVFTTVANRPTIAAGQTQSTVTMPDVVELVPTGGAVGLLQARVVSVAGTPGNGLTLSCLTLALN